MTVAELREALAAYPDTMRVVVPGYEGGLCDIQLETIHVLLNRETLNYNGPHVGDDQPGSTGELALAIYDAREDRGYLIR